MNKQKINLGLNQQELSNACVYRFPTPTSNSQMPAACLRIQLNSDTIYGKIEFDSTSKGLSPTTPLFKHQSQAEVVVRTSD